MMKHKIAGVGETVLDILLREGTKAEAAVPGGSTFNAIVSLGRTAARDFADTDVMMVTQLGDDAVADIVENFLKDNGVLPTYVRRIPGTQSNISLALLDKDSNATYEFFRDPSNPPFQAPEIRFNPGDAVIFGSFFALSPATGDQVRGLIRKAHADGATVYYDINFRKSHSAELSAIRPLIEENCSLSDIVRGSVEDIALVFGSDDPDAVYRDHISKLCSNFICTRGHDSTTVFSPGIRLDFPVQKVDAVSTIGAGDNFNAGFVYALCREKLGREEIRDMSPDAWKKLVPVAHGFSSNVCRSLFNYVDKEYLPLQV